MILPFIAVTNNSTVVDDDDVRKTLRVLQHHVNYDFGLHWNAGCVLKFVPDKKTLPEESWYLNILDEGKLDRVGGMHTIVGNQIHIEVYAKAATRDHPWSATASHEILEALANPWAAWCWSTDDGGEPTFVALEVCDPVEDDTYTCELDGTKIAVSNFVLPNWFRTGSKPKYDFKGLCTKPLEVRKGGSWLRHKPSDGWKRLRADGTEIGEGGSMPLRATGGKTPAAAKRISNYLYDLVNDHAMMEKYWNDRNDALKDSGLTKAQQDVLRNLDYAEFMKTLRTEMQVMYGTDFLGPDFLMPELMDRE